MKDLLSNIGSGGGAAAPAAAGGAAAEETKEEAKEEGELFCRRRAGGGLVLTSSRHREGGVRRGYGLRSLRLSEASLTTLLFPLVLSKLAWICHGTSRPRGWGTLISGVLVHRRSLLREIERAKTQEATSRK